MLSHTQGVKIVKTDMLHPTDVDRIILMTHRILIVPVDRNNQSSRISLQQMFKISDMFNAFLEKLRKQVLQSDEESEML